MKKFLLSLVALAFTITASAQYYHTAPVSGSNPNNVNQRPSDGPLPFFKRSTARGGDQRNDDSKLQVTSVKKCLRWYVNRPKILQDKNKLFPTRAR